MKLINPSVEIWEQDVTDPNTLVAAMWAHIARCVRVCYQINEPKCTETDEEYVRRVIFRNPDITEANHYSVLEHGAVYLKVPTDDEVGLPEGLIAKLWESKYTKRKLVNEGDKSYWYFSTNFRVIIENKLDTAYQYMVPFNPEHHYRRVTASFITDIGIAREFNRHRTHSISEESTRYCNYTKDRFDGDVTFIKPYWLRDNTQYQTQRFTSEQFEELCCESEYWYNQMLEAGHTPQQARQVLIFATKVQTVHTTFVDDWKHFFALRADGVSGPPHPDAQKLAKELKQQFINRKYIDGNQSRNTTC